MEITMSDTQFKKGLEDYNKKNYKDAFSTFKVIAKGDRGHTSAQYYLGLMYYNGQGVPKHNIYAYMWLSITKAKDDVGKVKQIAGKEIENLIKDLTKLMPYEEIAKAQDLAKMRDNF